MHFTEMVRVNALDVSADVLDPGGDCGGRAGSSRCSGGSSATRFVCKLPKI